MNPRSVRRLAMQLLYQFDLGGEADDQSLLASFEEVRDPPAAQRAAIELARAAWARREEVDQQITALTPDWPTTRQPPVDRAILRLGAYEIVAGRTPVKIAINEAVELAKRYASAESPTFINGVLDKLARELESEGEPPAPDAPSAPEADEAWLRDALDDDERDADDRRDQ